MLSWCEEVAAGSVLYVDRGCCRLNGWHGNPASRMVVWMNGGRGV